VVANGSGLEPSPSPPELVNSQAGLESIPSEMSDFLSRSPDLAFGGAFQAAPPAMTIPDANAHAREKKGSHERKHSSLRGFLGFGEGGSPRLDRHKKQSPKPSPKSSPRHSPTGSPEVSPRTGNSKAMKVLGL
jgi:hypothetical protein